jgi:hypothetical protein
MVRRNNSILGSGPAGVKQNLLLRNKGNARHCRKASKSNKMKHLNRSVWSPRPRCTGIRLM